MNITIKSDSSKVNALWYFMFNLGNSFNEILKTREAM